MVSLLAVSVVRSPVATSMDTISVRDALAWLDGTLEKDRAIRDDAARLKEILKITPEELCRMKGMG